MKLVQGVRAVPSLRRFAVPLSVTLALVVLSFAQIDTASAQFRRNNNNNNNNSRNNNNSNNNPAPAPAAAVATDPGVRGGPAGAGDAIDGLTIGQRNAFVAGGEDFAAAEEVPDGLGPRMNLDGCGGCHIQPANGGTSPAVNPQFAFATANGALDTVPAFITANGPIREARFVRNADGTADGGVHAIFTITGRPGATGCVLAQPNFAAEQANNNVIFRIPTPVFGLGLVSQITD